MEHLLSHTAADPSSERDIAARRAAMAVVAAAGSEEIAALVADLADLPRHEEIRPAESGLVMVRGRIGGDGAPFNLGEATVTRCAVRLVSGEIGFGHVLGRDHGKARLAALCDALWQAPDYRARLERHVLAPLQERQAAQLAQSRAQTATTKVDFFTMVRGEGWP
jgi:alpha-D-ribose 1-methylphosphonate 5-triphosphate synthase subunit PhnG